MNWPPQKDSEADVWSISPSSEWNHSNEELTLEMSASKSLYSDQLT